MEFCPSCCKATGFVILVFRSNAFCVCFFLNRSLLSSVLHCMRWPWVPNLTPLPLLPSKDETCDGFMGSSPESYWRHMFFCYKTSTKHVQSLVQRFSRFISINARWGVCPQINEKSHNRIWKGNQKSFLKKRFHWSCSSRGPWELLQFKKGCACDWKLNNLNFGCVSNRVFSLFLL